MVYKLQSNSLHLLQNFLVILSILQLFSNGQMMSLLFLRAFRLKNALP